MMRPCVVALLAAPAAAQPRFEWGGEAALGLRILWEGQSTADGFDARGRPAFYGQFGTASLGPAVATLALDYFTFGTSGGEGPVSVTARHHQIGVGPHVFYMDTSWRAGLMLEGLVEIVSTTNDLAGAPSRRGSGAHGGVRYGIESVARFGPLPMTGGLQIGGQRRDGRDDILLTLAFGWIWGAMSPVVRYDDYKEYDDPGYQDPSAAPEEGAR